MKTFKNEINDFRSDEEDGEEVADEVADEDFAQNDLKDECCMEDDNIDEQIHVRTERKLLPEDEDFMRDLDRIVFESMQVSFFV